MRMIRALACMIPLLSVLAAPPALAQTPGETAEAPAPPPAPYDDRLERLSEILGAVHYLRNLCAGGEENDWRVSMQKLLDLETAGEPARQERLTASFNRGYRSFAAIYTACTEAAVVAEDRYRNEGATLALEITTRFGN